MAFIEESLGPDEKITCRAATSKVAYLNALISFAILMMPLGLRSIARTELALTDKRIIGRSGGKVLKLAHKEIESVTVRRGFFGWIFDFGTVVVTAKDGTTVKFKNIVWPLVFQQEADEAIEMAVLGRKLTDFAPLS